MGVSEKVKDLQGGACVELDGLVVEGESDHRCHCDNEKK